MNGNSYEKWSYKYHNNKIVELKNYINGKDIEILKKLDILIEEKTYTLYEYDMIVYEILLYYEDETNEETPFKKSLLDKHVNKEDYIELANKIVEVSDFFNYNDVKKRKIDCVQ